MTAGVSDSLFQYQRDGIEAVTRLMRSNRAALLADPPGAGKTPQAVLTFQGLGLRRILVVCPSSLKENWRREMLRWSGGQYRPAVMRSGRDVPLVDAAEVVVVSYDLACRPAVLDRLRREEWDGLIFDEAHYLKSPSSQRARVCMVVLWGRATYRLAITGTPLPNGRAAEAWTLFSRLAPDLFGRWEPFRNAYCVPEETPWGVTYPRSKNLEDLGRKARERFMVRRQKGEVLGQLPPLVRQTMPLEVPALRVAECQDHFADVAEMVDRVVQAVESGVPLQSDAISTARRKLGLLKAGPAVEYVCDLLEEAGSAVVFAHHRDVIREMRDGFTERGITVVGITGETAPAERQVAVDAFQNGEAQVFLASLTAANTGVTLTRSSTVVFVEASWVPSDNEQGEGRVFRVTQTEITRAIYLVVPDSLDEAVTRAVMRKQRDITKVLQD
jgi:SWI/SNF-related matrix-associated actin-dependent regulator 1 of chromatin subfamily A